VTQAIHRPNLGRGRWTHDDREEAFLLNFYSDESLTKGNAKQSALEAGYAESTATDKAQRIIKKYNWKQFKQALAACGVNNLMMAMRMRKMIEKGGDKDALGAIRLALANKGEGTDERTGALNINSSGPIMVIVGASQERMKALRGAIPQLTREQQEELENQRVQDRLDQLKRGELPQLPSKSKAEPDASIQCVEGTVAEGSLPVPNEFSS
jgi:hypothetical protein